MSDFLSRLVQRTRGEAATVRPAFQPVTAPDPGAPAWDEQVSVRETARLARSPVHARFETRAESPTSSIAARLPGDAQREVAREHELHDQPTAQPSSVELAAAPVRVPERGEPSRHVSAFTPSPAVTATIPAQLQRAVQQHTPEPAPVPEPVPAPRTASERVAVVLEPAAEPAHARVSEAHVRAQSPFAVARPTFATAKSISTARTAGDDREGDSGTLAAQRSAPHVGSEPAPTTLVGHRPAVALALAAPDAPHGEVRAQGVGRPRTSEPDAAVHEHHTTVEVSIGRIEVRLPARAHGSAADASLSARRSAAVGLDAYLDQRNAGKTP